MRPRAVALFAAALVGLSAGASAAVDLRYGARVEAGGEYDTNPQRQEEVSDIAGQPTIQAAPALRLVSGLDVMAATPGGHLFSFTGEAAGKRFLDPAAHAEDLLLLDGRAAADFALGQRNRLGLVLAHYDAFQRAAALPDARDFRSTSPSLRFEHRLDGARVTAGGGWRWFTFKPEPIYDFQAPSAFLAYRYAWSPPLGEPGAEWDWGLTASYEDRRFDSASCSLTPPCPPTDPAAPRRRDRFFAAGAELNRTGDLLLGGGLGVQVNDSNSYGESLLRGALHLRAAVLLPLDLSLAGRIELVAARYADAVAVGRDPMTGSFVSIEEEGRSTLRIELMRPLGRRAETGARYTFWTSGPRSGAVRYARHSLVLFVAFLLAGQ